MRCHLCHQLTLKHVYTPPSSKLGVAIYACDYCGLAESWPKYPHSGAKNGASSGADFGGLRYGKGLVAEASLGRLAHQLPVSRWDNVLDVGANRGAFLLELLATEDFAGRYVGIEPDVSLLPGLTELAKTRPMLDIIPASIEQLTLSPQTYDVIYCAHTLEHLADPAGELLKLRRAVRWNGLLYLEVPNLEIISSPDVIEEFFIDRHLYHFRLKTLQKLLQQTGWSEVAGGITTDALWVIAQPWTGKVGRAVVPWYGNDTGSIICDYGQRLAALDLTMMANRLNEAMRREPTIIWGAGRIYDALCRAGLDSSLAAAIFDAYLPGVVRPHRIQEVRQVIPFSRVYFDEIVAAAELLGYNQVIDWRQVIERV